MRYVLFAAIFVIILVILAGSFFLVRRIFWNAVDRRIERFQSELIENQIRETRNMYEQVRGWRHDYRNHIQNMKNLLSEGNYQKLDGYLSELAEDLNTVDTVIKTGNVMADSALNSKLTTAQKMKIRLTVKAGVPGGIAMSDVELCAVMGNLLDNALEACAKLPEKERFMRVYIGCLKNQFYISVQNSAGAVSKSGGKYFTTKGGNSHGYGIFRIDRIVKKYGGYVNRQNEEGVFATEIMVPLSAKTA
ncbi:MAG: GHKL domain-containing protein [Ruminococcus sp.]|nr:GHKL domain-containing protein [Ruminococcus sp.]MCM1381772.1 GHKL domain-containing protein [Muribaculaceae bacterium]MCM1480525.1 GHKL domain-containing protein [Muribaculaceae bacterium]